MHYLQILGSKLPESAGTTNYAAQMCIFAGKQEKVKTLKYGTLANCPIFKFLPIIVCQQWDTCSTKTNSYKQKLTCSI